MNIYHWFRSSTFTTSSYVLFVEEGGYWLLSPKGNWPYKNMIALLGTVLACGGKFGTKKS